MTCGFHMIFSIPFLNMKPTFLILIFAFFVSSCTKPDDDIIITDEKPQPFDTIGNVYYIAQGGITDHSNANTVNSIAWHFKIHGAGNTYVLNSPELVYKLGNTLTVPENSIFRGDSGVIAKIEATSSTDNKVLIDLKSKVKMINLEIDGAKWASTLVRVDGKSDIIIDNCIVRDSKNNFKAGNPYTMLLYFISSSNVTVRNCKLYRAGWPKENPTGWNGLGYLILSRRCNNMTFQNNDLSHSITGGIDMTGSSKVKILFNTISHTGLNRESVGQVSISDAITAYHNWNPEDEKFTIKGNTISYAGNHGIHVSGKDIDIQDNTISYQQLSGIMVDDWRSKDNGGGDNDPEFSEKIIIKNNKCSDPLSWQWQPGNSNRKIYLNRVNNNPGITLDYTTNQDLSGATLTVNSTNYQLPTLFGVHE